MTEEERKTLIEEQHKKYEQYCKEVECSCIDTDSLNAFIKEQERKKRRSKYEKTLRFKIRRFFAIRKGEIYDSSRKAR